MLNVLKRLLSERHITIASYARLLGISEKTARNKLNGETEFTLSEVLATIELFPEYTITYVFTKSDNSNY